MKNPIVDNRIVSDIKFAIRLRDFCEELLDCDISMAEEDAVYFRRIANKLIKYQRETCTDDKEKRYFENIGEPIKD